MITDSVESKMHKLSKIIVLVMKLRELQNAQSDFSAFEHGGIVLGEKDVKEFVDFFLEEFNDITADIYAELGYSS